jgi:hypothetical protein
MWKANINLVMSVHLSTWNSSFPTGLIFIKYDILSIFKNLSRKSQVSLKSDQNNYMNTNIYLWSYLAQFLEWEMCQANL